MTQNLHDFLQQRDRQKIATDTGTDMHARLRHIVITQGQTCGDTDLINHIVSNPELPKFFDATAKTEVPIAGIIGDKFVSRRIDRLIINHGAKTVAIMDYKTDIDPDARISSYTFQLREYGELLRQIYPDYRISKFILWTHSWTTTEIH